ncbi:MAG: phage Gp37/Gp68 family protein [Lutibacter sp.]|jgi:protein gp37
MSKTKIEWTDFTWNPIIGCSKISEGCQNCYAEKMACRLSAVECKKYDKIKPAYSLIVLEGKWNNATRFVESALEKPLHWKKPRKIFVNSMGDTFHPSVPFEWIDKVLSVIARSKQHTFQILTKRADRMKEYFMGLATLPEHTNRLAHTHCYHSHMQSVALNYRKGSCLPNLWIGVTTENQQRADERIPLLLQTPAAVRFASCEPLLGGIDFSNNLNRYREIGTSLLPILDWVIVGGETGHNARPMNPEWAESIQRQCEAAGVPFFFKSSGGRNKISTLNGVEYREFPK